ncbi:MAG: transcription-repair coupling factor [Alphaproteobacteria bacterium]
MNNKDNLDQTITVSAAPGAVDAFWLAERFRSGATGMLLHIATDDQAMAHMAQALDLLVPGIEILTFPAWDCLPYDRVGPNGAITARRIDTLWRLATSPDEDHPGSRVIITTINAISQKVSPPDTYQTGILEICVGESLDVDALIAFTTDQGYGRAEVVMEPGEFAIRGGIIDMYPPGQNGPVRLDLFGDEVEKIRKFDPLTQISEGNVESIILKPVSEVLLTNEAITRFRTHYRERFGAPRGNDSLYESISEGRRIAGMEHWLPLFQDHLSTLFDYLPNATLSLGAGCQDALDLRLEQIADYFAARNDIAGASSKGNPGIAMEDAACNPLPPDCLYLDRDQWDATLQSRDTIAFDSFVTGAQKSGDIDAGARLMRNFSAEARSSAGNAFDLVVSYARDGLNKGQQVVFACASIGSVTRIRRLLTEHGLQGITVCVDWSDVEALSPGTAALICLDLEQGFSSPNLLVITEPDMLGRKLARARTQPRNRAAETFIAELSTLTEGDLVVHLEHGIGRYDGLETIEIPNADGRRPVAHDCLRLFYGGGDKLYVPVENIETLTRYGEDQGRVSLDRLGGAAWQAKKSRLKTRIREMAGELLKVAAARELIQARPMTAPEGAFEEFSARFPYTETEDQMNAITETLADMAGEKPMDRLICGDVGFGKTEVALRAAFVAALSGAQVSIVVPTTLLARQHYETFKARFEGFPIEIAQLSRMVSPKDTETIKKRLEAGTIDIVIGTHTLLSENMRFADLGLLVIDEEQHFGVAHKERLKKLRADVHVLTLTATPIPRTLQLAMTGVKEMSIIATPPIDRLAVRTFISPFDPLVIGEAIRRELHRGGQCFYVCPRISDIGAIVAQLNEIAPKARITTVHGQMPASDMEQTMGDFYDKKFDILISTNIIESGIDLPNVNTIIIHRSDMFGLGQLYQLRGRVGRSRTRAYAYLTLPQRRVLSPGAIKRLQVMQTLDSLGAGFSLASHDLDIRGAGNLLGEEQSGHIREVGVELYQQMLEETVAELKGDDLNEHEWSPEINIDIPVLIPESYVTDLGLRLGLYRRMGRLSSREEMDAFAAEMIDRFGPLPTEVENLMTVVGLKQACRAAGVAKLDAGSRGCLVSFHKDRFDNPAGLVEMMTHQAKSMKLRTDHTLVIRREWPNPEDRIEGLTKEINTLANLATAGKPLADQSS